MELDQLLPSVDESWTELQRRMPLSGHGPWSRGYLVENDNTILLDYTKENMPIGECATPGIRISGKS